MSPVAEHYLARPDGTRLRYAEAGDRLGPPVLFLHGLGYAAEAFGHQLASPVLAGCRLVAVDLRGHGASGWQPADRFDRATWAGDVDAFVRLLGPSPVTVVAWSYSGLVLADYLALHGTGSIAALGLVAAAVRAGFPEAYADFGAGALPDGFLSDDPSVARAGDALFVAESAGTAGFDEPDTAELQTIVGRTPREVLRRLLGRAVDNGELWAGVRLPTLLSHGTVDRINLPVISERQAVAMPEARLSWYQGMGHLPFWEDPTRFDRELLRLVEERRTA